MFRMWSPVPPASSREPAPGRLSEYSNAMYGASAPSPIFAEPAVQLEQRPDDAWLLRSSLPLSDYARCIGEYLEQWARRFPERPFLLERSPRGDWTGVSYGEA